MKKLIIVGGGAFGREIFHWAGQHPECGERWQIEGFIDDNTEALDPWNYPKPILGPIQGHQPEGGDLYLCAIAKPSTKEKVCRTLQSEGAEFITFVHPSVTIGGNVTLGTGSVLCPKCVLTCDIELGDFSMLNCGVTLGHDVRTGTACTINGNAELTGGVTLGDRVFVGSHVTTHPGASIQDDATLGLGSAIIGRVKAGQSVLGVPARRI